MTKEDPFAVETATLTWGGRPTGTPRGFTWKMGLAQFGLMGALYTPVLITMALRIDEVDHKNATASLSMVLGVGALFALFVNPLVGRLSDRTTSRFGRRRPWLVGGVVAGVIGFLIMAFVPSVPIILLGWVVVQGAFNATLAAMQATVPDQVAEKDLGKVSGVIGFAQTVCVIVCVPIATIFASVSLQFLIPAVAAALFVCLFAFTLRDKRLTGPRPPFDLKEFIGSYWTNPLKHRDFAWAWWSKLLVSYGTIAPGSYLLYFLMSDLGNSTKEATANVGILIFVTYALMAVTAFFGGWISDLMGGRRKPMLIISSLIQFVGLGLLVVAPNFEMVMISQILMGIGGGLFYGVDLAIANQVLPNFEDAAKDLGVINMANVLPQTIAPFLAAIIFAIGGASNFRLFFGISALISILGTIAIPRIRGVR